MAHAFAHKCHIGAFLIKERNLKSGKQLTININIKTIGGNIMNLVRFNQHPVFSNFFENFEKSLAQTFDDERSDMPMVNVKDEDKKFVVELAAPGMDKKDFKINLENNNLTISSEKKEEKTEKNKNYTMREFSFNSFSRSFALPKNIKVDQIDANYKNGVLIISLPKKEEEAKLSRQISIK